MEVFLGINGLAVNATNTQIVELALRIEADRADVEAIENWLRDRVR